MNLAGTTSEGSHPVGDANQPTLLLCDRVTVKRRQKNILDKLSLRFNSGILGILGPNGAGKTTLLQVLGLGMRMSEGSIVFRGENVRTRAGQALLRAKTGYQSQTAQFDTAFTVREAVSYAAWLKGVPKSNIDARTSVALERTRIGELGRQRLRKLSGGQAKRVSIAQAIVHEPALVLLDEPTATLDPAERMALLHVLRDLAETSNIILTTHLIHDVEEACSEVLVIARGRARFSGPVAEFTNLGGAPGNSSLDLAYTRAVDE